MSTHCCAVEQEWTLEPSEHVCSSVCLSVSLSSVCVSLCDPVVFLLITVFRPLYSVPHFVALVCLRRSDNGADPEREGASRCPRRGGRNEGHVLSAT